MSDRRKIAILLNGDLGSGKDTAGKALVDALEFTRVASADELKDEVAKQYKFERHLLDNSKFKDSPMLNYPVMARDDTSRMINLSMGDTFRTVDNKAFSTSLYIDRDICCPYMFGDCKTFLIGTILRFCIVTLATVATLLGGQGSEEIFADKNNRLYFTPRSILIKEGCIKRSTDPCHWIKKVVEKINKTDGDIVLTDCRFCNEAEYVKDELRDTHTVIVVRVRRYSSVKSSDPSERDMDNYVFDYEVHNNGTREEFGERVINIVKTTRSHSRL